MSPVANFAARLSGRTARRVAHAPKPACPGRLRIPGGATPAVGPPPDSGAHSARADRILRGANAAGFAVGQPVRIAHVVNARTADTPGSTPPRDVPALAAKVIR